MVPNFVPGTQLKKNRKTSPQIGYFVHHIDSGDQTHFFNFLKSAMSIKSAILQIWGIKVQNWDKVRAFYGMLNDELKPNFSD